MKRLIVLVLAVVAAFAQQHTLTLTTTSAAITNSQNIVVVASASGIVAPTSVAAGSILYVRDAGQVVGEKMPVVSISGTTVTVRRADKATAHASGAQVLIGYANWYYSVDPAGSCSLSTTYVAPYINTVTGQEWTCETTWVRSVYWGAVTVLPPTTSVSGREGRILVYTRDSALNACSGTGSAKSVCISDGSAWRPLLSQ